MKIILTVTNAKKEKKIFWFIHLIYFLFVWKIHEIIVIVLRR